MSAAWWNSISDFARRNSSSEAELASCDWNEHVRRQRWIYERHVVATASAEKLKNRNGGSLQLRLNGRVQLVHNYLGGRFHEWQISIVRDRDWRLGAGAAGAGRSAGLL